MPLDTISSQHHHQEKPRFRNARFKDVTVLVADTMRASRDATRNALYDLGIREFTVAESVDATRTHLAKGGFDLLIADAYLMDEGTAEIVSAIRGGKLGSDPFIPVIALTWEPTIEVVQELVSAGIDLMLTLPMSVNKINQALDTLVNRRKPFVITSDYIGPDRRTEGRSDLHQVPQITVPNALRRRVTGSDDGISPEEVLQNLHDQRALRLADRAVYTIGKIAGLVSDQDKGTMATWIADLHKTVQELTDRLPTTRYRRHLMLSRTLLEVVERIQGCSSPDSSEMEIMQQLALSVQVGFSQHNTSSIDDALDISAAVKEAVAV